MSSRIALRRSPKLGRLDGERVDVAAQLVDDERGQCFAVDVVGDDHDVLRHLEHLLEHRAAGPARREMLLVRDQDVGVVEDGFHAVGVGDEVGGDVAAVELHALHELGLHADALALFDGDDAVLADLLHDVGDDVADLLVVAGDGGDLGDLLLAGDRRGDLADLVAHGSDTPASRPRLRLIGLAPAATIFMPSRTIAWARTVAVVVPSPATSLVLRGDLAGELGAEVLERVLELDLLGDGDAVVDDRRGAELLLEDDVAAARAEGYADGVGEGVDAGLERAARLFIEQQLLCGHGFLLVRRLEWKLEVGLGSWLNLGR